MSVFENTTSNTLIPVWVDIPEPSHPVGKISFPTAQSFHYNHISKQSSPFLSQNSKNSLPLNFEKFPVTVEDTQSTFAKLLSVSVSKVFISLRILISHGSISFWVLPSLTSLLFLNSPSRLLQELSEQTHSNCNFKFLTQVSLSPLFYLVHWSSRCSYL